MGKRLTTDTHVEITFRHHTFLGFPSFSPSFWVFITLSPGLTKEPVLLALMISPAVLVRSSEPPVDTGKPREHRPESQHLWGAGTSTVEVKQLNSARCLAKQWWLLELHRGKQWVCWVWPQRLWCGWFSWSLFRGYQSSQYLNAYMWNLEKKSTDDVVCKTEIETQT